MEIFILVALSTLVAIGILVVIILNKIRSELRLLTTYPDRVFQYLEGVIDQLDQLPKTIAWYVNENLPESIASSLTTSHLADRIGVKVSEEMMGTHRLPETVAKCVSSEIESFGDHLRSIAENTSYLKS